MRLRVVIVVAVIAAACAVIAGPAFAGTWYITPTLINETTDPIALAQFGVNDGDFQVHPSQLLNPGNEPNDNGNTTQYEFDAPHLDEGADGMVDYDTADGSQFNMMVQDDVNGLSLPINSSPTCIDAKPTGPVPKYSCAATFGGNGPYPENPSPSPFSPYFNLRDNYTDPPAPAGARSAQVTAVGQTCDDELSNGQSLTCTASQPTMSGFSPTDPDNYQTLLFVDRGDTPVTVTDTDTFMLSLLAQNPSACIFLDEYHQTPVCSSPSGGSLPAGASTSCTMNGWGQTCQLQTSGGANSLAFADIGPYRRVDQAGNASSDQISISPGAPSPNGSDWYGVRVYGESEVSNKSVEGLTLFDLFVDMAAAYGSLSTGPVYWVPDADHHGTDRSASLSRTAEPGFSRGQRRGSGQLYWNPAADDAITHRSASLNPGASLRSGQVLSRGAFRLTMRRSGDLVEDVAVNGDRFPVWSSGTRSAGARATLGHDGNLVIRGRDGKADWSTKTHGGPAARFELDKDGRLVLRATANRVLFHTAAISYPLPARNGSGRLAPGLGLTPGDELRRGGVRLIMQDDGNLVLARAGRTLWSTHTGGHAGAFAWLRADGELLVSTPHHRVLWSSHTASRRVAGLSVRANGTLVMLGLRHRVIWHIGRYSD